MSHDDAKGMVPLNRKEKMLFFLLVLFLVRSLLLQMNDLKYSLVKVWEP